MGKDRLASSRAGPAPSELQYAQLRRDSDSGSAGPRSERGLAARGKRGAGAGHCGGPAGRWTKALDSRPAGQVSPLRARLLTADPAPRSAAPLPRFAPPGPSPARSPSRGSGPLRRRRSTTAHLHSAASPQPPPHLSRAANLRASRPSQKTPRRAEAQEAGHRRTSARAAAAASRRTPLRSPITQSPSSASRVGGRPGRGGGCGGGAERSSDASGRLPGPLPSDYTASPLAKLRPKPPARDTAPS